MKDEDLEKIILELEDPAQRVLWSEILHRTQLSEARWKIIQRAGTTLWGIVPTTIAIVALIKTFF